MQKLFRPQWVLSAIFLLCVSQAFAMFSRNPMVGQSDYEGGYLIDDSEGEPITDINGIPWRFDKYKGRWIIVSYWASYCPPCLTMIPELNAIYRGREGKQAMVLGVNYDFVSKAEVHDLVKEFNITYPVTQGDPAAKLGIAPVDVLPMTIIINPEGKATHYLQGMQTQVSLENLMRTPEEN